MRRVPPEEPRPTELVAVGEADLARIRDRLAEIEAEYAMLEAELAVFEADYTREVVTVLAQLHDVEARILARSGDRAAATEAFMKRLNDAYRTGDAEAVADLLRQWDASPFAPGSGDDGARRVAAVQAA